MRGEAAVHLAADDARAKLDFARIRILFIGGEPFTDQRQDAIGDRLAGQAGAGGAEGDRRFVLFGCAQHSFQVIFRFDDGDDFWCQAIKAGIGAIGQASQVIDDDLVVGQVLTEVLDEFAHGGLGLLIADA